MSPSKRLCAHGPHVGEPRSDAMMIAAVNGALRRGTGVSPRPKPRLDSRARDSATRKRLEELTRAHPRRGALDDPAQRPTGAGASGRVRLSRVWERACVLSGGAALETRAAPATRRCAGGFAVRLDAAPRSPALCFSRSAVRCSDRAGSSRCRYWPRAGFRRRAAGRAGERHWRD